MGNSPGDNDAIATNRTPSGENKETPAMNGPVGSGPDLAARPALPEARGIAGWFRSHPVGFWFFFWGEFAERASYYGMRAILTLYMADVLGFGQAGAARLMSFFIGGCYLLPLVGGFVADRFLGKYWTIVGFSIPYILGQVIIGIEDRAVLIPSLVLLAMGSGVIKPNISTLMGNTYDLYRPGQTRLRSEAFAMFYFSINVGAFLSQLFLPPIRTAFGYGVAFLFPAGLMIFALGAFAAGKRFYAPDLLTREEKTPEERRQQWAVLGRLFGVFLLVTFFWAIFDQSATTWIFFAKDHLDLNLLGRHVDPDQIQAFNPLFIMVFLPLITAFWSYLDVRGIKVRATDKIMVGFLLTAAAMGIHVAAAYLAEQSGTRASLWWQVIAYLMLTWAEILISVTGLELAFAAAPKTMKGFITACWLLTVAIANFVINAPLTGLYPSFPTAASYFSVLTITMLVVSAVFFFVARAFNRGMEKWQAEEAAKQTAETPAFAAMPTSESVKAADDALRTTDPGNFIEE